MIASYAHNFIFVKTRKTSGTSAEIVMSAWCSGKDICTPISPEDEVERRKLGGKAMNYRRWLIPVFTGHMPASEISSKIPDLWQTAYKFTVDRHPYEKVVSQTAYRLGRNGEYSEEEFRSALDDIIALKKFINYPLYMKGGKPIVDKVMNYKDFWNDLKNLSEKLGTKFPEKIPTAKSRFKKNFVTTDSLDNNQRNQIYEIAAPEFELMGWER